MPIEAFLKLGRHPVCPTAFAERDTALLSSVRRIKRAIHIVDPDS